MHDQSACWLLAGVASGHPFRMRVTDRVVLCINRRLGLPRDVTYSGEESFDGWVRNGSSGTGGPLSWRVWSGSKLTRWLWFEVAGANNSACLHESNMSTGTV